MILPILLVLQNPTGQATPTADRPIRIWMDAPGEQVSRGRGVRLYINAGTAGSLVVLHSRTDGKIEVLFPARPTDDPHITPGTWEVRGTGDRPIWTVAEPNGAGMILAALTPDPVWFDEFSHDVSWNPDALQPSWSGADAEGGMQDIVQRMLGDGGFTYDVLTYTVVPEAIAQAPAVPQSAPAFPGDPSLNPDDTFPTIDHTPQDATKLCDVSNPDVYCSYFNDPLVFGRGFHHRRHFVRPAPAPSLPTPANPQGIALMVIPIHSRPSAPSSGPVVQRKRPVPQVPVRTRGSSPPVAPAPTARTAIRTLASHPVTGAEVGRLAGAAPAARSVMVLRYVHPPARPPATTPTSGVVATAVTAPPRVERVPSAPTTVAANLPVRASGTMLMSRAVSPSAAAGVTRGAAPRAPVVATRPAPAAMAAPAPRTTSGWMVLPRRR